MVFLKLHTNIRDSRSFRINKQEIIKDVIYLFWNLCNGRKSNNQRAETFPTHLQKREPWIDDIAKSYQFFT